MNWKSKLTSRKFWAAIIGFVTPLLLAFGVSSTQATQITGIIMAGASVVAYIIGEGLVDASGASNPTDSNASAAPATSEPTA